MRSPTVACVFVTVLACTSTAAGQSSQEAHASAAAAEPQGDSGASWFEWTWATGDWHAARERLADRGVSLDVNATSDLSRVRSTSFGNNDVGRTLFDATLAMDLQALCGWRGLAASIQYYAKAGGNGAEYAGSRQGFSNLDADSFSRIGEIWIEQSTARERLRVKVGRLDANQEFATIEAAADFLNPSMGYSPTILGFPTYPEPRFGVNLVGEPSAHFGVAVGAYRGIGADRSPVPNSPRDVFAVAEIRSSWTVGEELSGSAKLGMWRYTGRLERVDELHASQRGAQNAYVTLEQTLWREPGRVEAPATRQVRVFLQWGQASARVSEIDRHLGAGIAWYGPLRRRTVDVVGVGVTTAHLHAISGIDSGNEIAVSTFYKHQFAPWLALQPDVQYVVYPAGAPRRQRELFITWRLHVVL